MKKLLLIFILTFLNLPSFAYDVAFPLDKELTLEQDGVFFVGKANKKENVWINDKKVDIKKKGSFAETFKLLIGDNIFYVGNDEKRKQDKYIITRVKSKDTQTKLSEFSTQDCKTTCNNVILRATPIDFGMNRLGYLPKNTDLQITGTKNEFSRVYLNKNLSGWVMTKQIMPEQRENTTVGEYRGESINSDSNSIVYCYKFSKNLPYSVVLNNNRLMIDVYNVENRPNETFHSELILPNPNCYSAKMNDGILSIGVQQNILKHIKIVIDAGHGGKEPGAVGCLGDIEKDMNLKTAKALKNELKSKGYDVVMTRKSDKFVSLNDRVNYAISKHGIIFISLHMNSIPESADPNTHKGTGTYYYTDFSKPLAENIQTETVKSLGTKDNGITQASFAVIRPTEYVGVLVETAYMINPEDVELYKSKDFFKKVAIGVANGVNKYLKELQ